MSKLLRSVQTVLDAKGDPAFGQVPLNHDRIAIVDLADIPLVGSRNWCIYYTRTGGAYARSRVPGSGHTGKVITMHQFLMNAPAGMEVDHQDGDGLNNRRSNLRICSHQSNMRNMAPHRGGSSQFKGVSWFKRDNCWRSYIVASGKQLHLGYFQDEASAARAYDAVARRLFGEFARLNFDEQPVAGKIGEAV